MRLLLDTHILVWAIRMNPLLPKQAVMLISDSDSELYVSTVAVWETAIKHEKRPEQFPLSSERLIRYCNENGVRQLPLYFHHVDMFTTLTRQENAPVHNDPFDKIMIAQAKAENMFFLTHNSLLKYYDESCILFV